MWGKPAVGVLGHSAAPTTERRFNDVPPAADSRGNSAASPKPPVSELIPRNRETSLPPCTLCLWNPGERANIRAHAETRPLLLRLCRGMSRHGSAEALRKSHKEPPVCPTDDEAVTPKRKTQSFDYVWRSGVAGGFAGSAAKTVVAPLDRVKILFQASNPRFAKYTGSWFGVATAMKDIYRYEGATGLYRGHSATLLRIFPYAGIKFLAYEQIRAIIIPHKSHETPMRRLVSGSLAGVTSVFFTYPLEVIRVRLAFETKREGHSSLSSICRQIYNEQPVQKSATARLPNAPVPVTAAAEAAAATVEAGAPRTGLVNFYRGFTPTLLGMVPYAGVSFLTHDTVGDIMRSPAFEKYTTLPKKQNHPPGKPAPLRSWAELCSGGIAGLISQTASYPLEVIRRRMQVGGAVGDGRRLRIGETASMIFRERGIPGFYVGLTIGYVKVIPMVAIGFYTYERMKLVFGI
ncbi:mitochondrial carrier leu5 [Fusarium albosuccineum]|uniref:Mitochondrial thiamine pyrophosphate carrier 1 n=1 Tax=Fusarium albosuccineum TaxID=1237068 RepID=A0A8H4P756_9HYPO|nr:mitochondrial carrier leu5 [Fusarium albosuccineum]